MHTVAILALEDVAAFDLTIPCQVFGMAHGPDGSPAYEVRVCAGRTVTATAGRQPSFRISSPYGLDAARDADTVIVPGVRPDRAPSQRAVRLIREVADRGGRVASICTGAFVLAKAGLLDGHRATTHWMFAGQLAQRFPDVEVDPSVLFVDNGRILTSAGVVAGLDLCLHMVRRDLGAAAAARTARMIVMAPQRAGGQAQFIEHHDPLSNTDHLGPVLEWMQENLDQPLTVADIARRAAMSSRSLSRRFRAQTGTTPLQWLLQRRLQRARELLETTDLTMERVARTAGFGSTETLRHHFSRHVGTTPTSYRATFQG
ncbi:helix-turn-helix domain-containing protein [Streptomyces nigrescens]|uniref:GlxA family transcriptional regulator n=1 Tax=Streptomyces nigrescens TaxID=1920 RepID=UPI00349A4299